MSARLDRVRALSSAYSALQQDLPLLEERVELLRAIIADETTLDAPLARYQHHLGAALYERFLHLNEISYLIEAEACLRLAIPHLSLEPSDVGPGIILGSVLREQAYDTRSRMLAEEALALHRQPFLVNLEMPDLEQAHHCRELGLTLRICYFIDANRGQDLLESVQHLQAARAIFTRMGIIDHACTAGLILALINLYNVQADQALLNEASPIGDLALAQCEPNHRDFYRVVWSVATVYRFRAWVLDDSLALLKTLGILRKALVHAPPGWATPLSVELLDLLRLQFMKQGNDDDLSEAVALATTLLDRLSPEAPRWDQLQASLAHNLLLRFRMTGAVADIENAVHAAQSALSRTNVGTARYFLKLNQLAECRDAQYLAFGDMMHLNDCIASTELIVQLAPSHSTDRRLAEHNLIDSLRLRSKVTGSLDDLDRAIALVPESFKSQVFDHPNAASMLHGIGQTFLSRFKMTGSRDDLERATAWIYEATQRCKNRRESSQHFKHHIIMNAYAKLLRIRYEVLDEADGVAMALTEQRELANTMPAIHADRASILCGLAQTLICANKLDSGHEYVEEALNCLLDALSISHCPAYRRLKDVANVLTYLTKSPPCLNHDETFKLSGVYSQTISLLPQVASFGLDPRTRLSVISSSGRLTGQGASHAIAVGQYELALEMLEAGRNVFWTQGLHIRTAFTNLPPEIGDRLTGITTALGQPMPEYSDQGSAKERELARRRRLGDDFAAVLMEARSLPGFEDLLRNASFASLARTAQQHPIVVLVAGENVGYALIIDEGAQVILVTLEKANEANLRALSHRIEMHSQHIRSSRGIRKVQAVAQAGLDDVYQELWISVMLPIVDALGLPKVQGRDRRRLTLCPTGVLMQLPLHAAGVYAVDHQICCSDYFVPSYVPSIGALLHAQQTYKPVRRADAEMLIVAVEHPFEGQALPMISEESSTVHAHVSPLAKVVQVSESGDVFKHIQSASILHMACHGTQNLVDALQSGFFLEDELLPVSKLMQLDLPQAFLAVLSACETAKGDASQPDQAIHMAATMLFAGFKSVVATMWFMRDFEGPVVADSIYSTLLKDDDGAEYLNPDDIPYALDDAVRKLRLSGLDPSFWATYVHIGI